MRTTGTEINAPPRRPWPLDGHSGDPEEVEGAGARWRSLHPRTPRAWRRSLPWRSWASPLGENVPRPSTFVLLADLRPLPIWTRPYPGRRVGKARGTLEIPLLPAPSRPPLQSPPGVGRVVMGRRDRP